MAKKSASKSQEPEAASSGLPLSAACRFVILNGKDLFGRAERMRELRKALEKVHGEVDTVVFDGKSSNAAEILDECRSFGLIARHKIVMVDDADFVVKEDSRPLFERYAASPCDGTTLVLRADRLVPGNLGKAVEKIGSIIACVAPGEIEAKRWVKTECKPRHKIAIDDDAADLLVDRIGAVLAQLDTELAKLAVAADPAPSITRDLVVQFVGKTRDEDIWSMQRTIMTSTNAGRLESIRHNVMTLRQPGTLILFTLSDLARKVHVISRGVKAGANPFAIKKAAKLWGDKDDVIFNWAASTDWKRAVGIYRSCVEADRRSKSGFGDAERSSEICALRFPPFRRA
jgi:DNA polymerase III delta subunit